MKTKTKANTNLQSASMSGTCGRVCLHRPEGREGGEGRRRGQSGLISVLPHVRPTTTTMGAAASALGLVGRVGETAKMGDWGWSVNNA